MDEYFNLTHKKTFVGNQPITLSSKTFKKGEKYFLTYKLDGLRHLLLLNCDNSFYITSKMVFKKIKSTKTMCEVSHTLLDTEFYKRKWYIFDILFYKGQDLRQKTLSERLKILQVLVKKINSKRLILKPYISPYQSSLYTNFKELLNKYHTQMYDGSVDGIIFTPDVPYSATVLKWKPAHLLSIDFKIKKLGDNAIALLTQKNTVFTSKKFPGIGIVKLSPKEYKKYKDGDVVEFIFDKQFIPLRKRPDKVQSNYISVILSNFNEIVHPTNIEKLLK